MRFSKNVKGSKWDLRFMRMEHTTINVQITTDELGQTLSLSDNNTMFTIPLEQLKEVLKVVER